MVGIPLKPRKPSFNFKHREDEMTTLKERIAQLEQIERRFVETNNNGSNDKVLYNLRKGLDILRLQLKKRKKRG